MASIIIDAVRLPVYYEKGAEGGPQFKTTVLKTDGGRVTTNQHYSQPLWKWNIGYGLMSRSSSVASFEELLAFFMERRGRSRGFLFKNWIDYKLTNQLIGVGGVGGTTAFQLVKTYGSLNMFSRPVTRPVTGTIPTILQNGVPKSISTHYTVSLTTGIVTFLTAVPEGETVVVPSCEYNFPVMFSDDWLAMNIEWDQAAGVPDIPIEEVRE